MAFTPQHPLDTNHLPILVLRTVMLSAEQTACLNDLCNWGLSVYEGCHEAEGHVHFVAPTMDSPFLLSHFMCSWPFKYPSKTTWSTGSRRRTQNKCNSVDLNGKGVWRWNRRDSRLENTQKEAEKESRLETRKDLQFFKQDGSRAGRLWVLSSPTETVASNPVFRMEVRTQWRRKGFRIQCLCKKQKWREGEHDPRF